MFEKDNSKLAKLRTDVDNNFSIRVLLSRQITKEISKYWGQPSKPTWPHFAIG